MARFSSARCQSDPANPQTQAPGSEDGGLLGGLDGLIEKLKTAGQGDKADSWVGTGENKPIRPNDLGKALGGVSEEELLKQLSTALPGVVDKLTPNGNLPDKEQVAAALNAA